MKSKTSLIVVLVVLNLVLLSALLIGAVRTPSAYAQQAAIATNYLAIAAEMQNGYDGVYLIDLSERKLYLLAPARGERTGLELIDGRDLKDDFRVRIQP